MPRTRSTIAGLILTSLLAFLLVLLGRRLAVNPTTIALAFLLLVVVASSWWRLPVSIYLCLLLSGLYNFFFLPPIGRLAVADTQNWVALAAFLAAGLTVSKLADRSRRHAEEAVARQQETEKLYLLSRQMMLKDNTAELKRAIPGMVAAEFSLAGVALCLGETGEILSTQAEVGPPLRQALAEAARGNTPAARPQASIVPLGMGMRATGALAFLPPVLHSGVENAVAGLVATAIERAQAVERFSAAEAARQGEKLRATLIDSLAHDLRTPLTAIRAAVTSLTAERGSRAQADGALQPALDRALEQELIDIVDEESARLDEMIGRALEMAQLDQEQVRVLPFRTTLMAILEPVVQQAGREAAAAGLRLEVEAGEDIVLLDGPLVARALHHLLENSIRYSKPGGTVWVTARRAGDDTVRFTVRDQGMGIDPADLPHVFEKFYRGRGRKAGSGGSGMGLAIAHAIVQAMGGEMSIESAVDRGTTVAFSLPQGRAS